MDSVLIACRFAHFSAAMLLFGGSAFVRFVRPAGEPSPRRASRASITMVLALAVTGLLWFGLEAGNAGAGWADVVNPAVWAALASGTSFGQVWVWHLALCLALLPALALRGSVRRPTLLIGSAALLASLGLVGHAAMQQGALGWVHRINQMLHLLAAGFWVGALPPLLVALLALRAPQRRDDATATLEHFSGLGHVAVAVTLLTGIVNTGLILGGLPTNFSSPYQALLALKIGLVGLMLSLAMLNRYMLTPRLALRGIVIGTGAEILLGLAIIALVSAFGTYDPV